MAEAHSAVAFSFAVTHEGWDVNFDREVLRLVIASGLRSWKKRFLRFQNNLRNGIYPASPQSLWAMVVLIAAIQLAGYSLPFNHFLLSHMPGNTVFWQFFTCFLLGLFAWLIVIHTIRYTLKLLLMYKGWMFEQRTTSGKPSLSTRMWAIGVKVLSGTTKPLLYSYQGSLPRLPLPCVHDTMQRYLRSVRPLLNDGQYEKMKQMATEFQEGIGVKLQRYLILKSWFATNYVSDWWEEYVYLRGRSPLIVNSNFYGIDAISLKTTHIQAARAAAVIHIALQYRRLIERQELEPILLQGLVPLCSWQYERMFNTTRVPGTESDKIVHYNDSKHIAVYHRGRYYKVIIYYRNRLLQPCEIEQQIQMILDDTSPSSPGEEKLAALTAGNRTEWAETRRTYFFKGINRISLDAIEKAAFVVALDDIPYEYSDTDPSKLDQYGRTLLHGNGYNRWFDKSFTLCIGSNGRIGFNAEHSWADAAVISHLWEYIILEDGSPNKADAPVVGHLWEYIIGLDMNQGYDSEGHTKGVPELQPPKPIRMQWDLPQPAREAIEKSHQIAHAILSDLDLRILTHKAYGKGFMKTCRVSPDAYIQMALQLAYYRDAGKFSLTYEASMTRLYREGRTETVRPCTIESAAWVKAMENPSTSIEDRINLLKKACAIHQRAYQDAMIGKGIDRHLFCLYVVSKYLEVDSPFLKAVLSEPWRLSTSQTPHGQTSRFNVKENPDCISAGGGFGPVADDGYGVSYIIAGEDLIFFHISSKISSPETDSNRFARNIEKALDDMKNLFLTWKTSQKKINSGATS